MSPALSAQILIIGYGHTDQLDDGIGPELARAVGRMHLSGVTVLAEQELSVSAAAAIAGQDVVVFVEANAGSASPFEFFSIEPDRIQAFVTLQLSPQGVLALAQDLFHSRPDAYLLRVRGYEFNDYAEALTNKGRRNLERSLAFLKDFLEELPSLPLECHKNGPGGGRQVM